MPVATETAINEADDMAVLKTGRGKERLKEGSAQNTLAQKKISHNHKHIQMN